MIKKLNLIFPINFIIDEILGNFFFILLSKKDNFFPKFFVAHKFNI